MTDLPLARAATRRPILSTDALARIAAGLVILAVWQGAVMLWAPAYVARPSGIVSVLPSVLSDLGFWRDTGVTVLAVLEGLVIAVVLGTVIGLAIGRSRIAENSLELYVSALFAMPMTAILPLLTLWFGYSSAARLVTIVFASIFAIIVNVSDGARAVPREFIEVSRSFRSSNTRRLFEVVLPASMPYLIAGIRLAAGRALIGAVVAEFFAAIPGVGYYILLQTRTFHHDEAFVGVLLLAAAGVAVELLTNAATRRYLPWFRRDEA